MMSTYLVEYINNYGRIVYNKVKAYTMKEAKELVEDQGDCISIISVIIIK